MHLLSPVTDLAHYLYFHAVSNAKNSFRPCDQRGKCSQFAFERQMGHAAFWVIFFYSYILQTLIIIMGILPDDYSIGPIVGLI